MLGDLGQAIAEQARGDGMSRKSWVVGSSLLTTAKMVVSQS